MSLALKEGKNFVIRALPDMKLWEERHSGEKKRGYDFNQIDTMPNAKRCELEINGKPGMESYIGKGNSECMDELDKNTINSNND